MKAKDIATLLGGYRFDVTDEATFQDAVAEALEREGIEYDREVNLSPACRIDFVCGAVGLELKIQGRPAEVERQLDGYAQTGKLEELVLVTTRHQHRAITVAGRVPVTVALIPAGIV